MQDRNPCSGCGRERRMISTRAAVSSPMAAASLDALVRPVAVSPRRARHVLGNRGRPVRPQAAQMRRHQLAAMKDLHRPGGDARLTSSRSNRNGAE